MNVRSPYIKEKAIQYWTAFSFFIISTTIHAQETALNSAEAKDTKSAQGYTTTGDQFDRPLTNAILDFDCDDKVFAVVELQNYPKEKHHLSVRWIDPHANQREHTQYPFHIHNTKTRIWAWLGLSRATGAGMLKWIDPAIGYEEFIGEWKAEVRIDDKSVATLNFNVIC